jgi:hypothetical protein
LIGVALVVLLGAVWNGLQYFSPSSPINSANFAKIKKGMTCEEVHAILGKPEPIPGWKDTWGDPPLGVWESIDSQDPPPWVFSYTRITIIFDETGRVVTGAELIIEERSWEERFAKWFR